MYTLQSEAKTPAVQSHKTRNRIISFLAVAVVIALIAADFAYFAKVQPRNTYSDSDYDAGMACIMAEKLIKPQLKAPTSAEFDYADCQQSAVLTGHTWTLHSYIDADNSFGAHIRTRYVVQITYESPPSNMWHMENLTFLDN